MRKIYNSFRVSFEYWHSDEKFAELIALVSNYRPIIDQIAFFTSITHTPLTLTETENRLKVMKSRIHAVKNLGISCGVNLLGTLGHHSEDLAYSLDEAYARLTNIAGEICQGSFCMNDPAFIKDYIKPVYTMLSEAEPDFIWIDDDVRYGHLPIGNGCFCDNCVDLFNKTYGFTYSRNALRDALNAYDIPLRKKFLKHQAHTIIRLFKAIREAVNSVNDQIILGFMTGERYFEGFDFAGFADALSQGGKYEIMWRPGGGGYTDNPFNAFSEKASQIGRQCAYLPECVTSIQSEIENFPYQLIKKSPCFTAVEAAMYLAAGCTGTAFNILPFESGEPIGVIEKHMEAIRDLTPFYRYISDTCGRSPSAGIHTGWCPLSQSAVDGDFFNGSGGVFASYAQEMFDFGFPESHSMTEASAYMLSGKGVYALTDTQITHILSGTVYMDLGAVEALSELGYGAYIGFRGGKNISVDAREIYLAHQINESFIGKLRNCRQAFYRGDSYELLPQEGAEPICGLVDYHGRVLADCSMGRYKNQLGGTVYAAGYYPFSWISDTYKTTQLKRIFGDCLISYPETYCRINTSVRFDKENRPVVILQNTNPDLLKNVRIHIKTDQSHATLTDMRLKKTMLAVAQDAASEHKLLIIPEIQPWAFCIIELN